MNKILFWSFFLFLISNFSFAQTEETTQRTEDFSAPPIYHTEEPEEKEEWIEESLGTYGSPIKDYEYRDQWDKQAKNIQHQASLPFGQAGKPFGEKKAEFDGKESETIASAASPAPAVSASPSSKPRVLVS